MIRFIWHRLIWSEGRVIGLLKETGSRLPVNFIGIVITYPSNIKKDYKNF